jgi:hypothetical protein
MNGIEAIIDIVSGVEGQMLSSQSMSSAEVANHDRNNDCILKSLTDIYSESMLLARART